MNRGVSDTGKPCFGTQFLTQRGLIPGGGELDLCEPLTSGIYIPTGYRNLIFKIPKFLMLYLVGQWSVELTYKKNWRLKILVNWPFKKSPF